MMLFPASPNRPLGALLLALLLAGTASATDVPVAAPPTPAAPAIPMPPAPKIDAKSWVLVDFLTGRVLAEKEPDLRVEPASITKVMTSYVVASERKSGKIKDDDAVFISEHAWRNGGGGTDGSTSFIPLNSSIPLHDLLMGMIIQSGNDAAIALAEHVAGSEETFAALMNQYAERLGMKQTHFVNASGLHDPNHYTSARDIAILSRALIRDFPEDYAAYAVKQFTINGITQHNRNTLLWRDPSVDGIKTGHHKEAGYCLAASAKRGDTRLISVIMGSSGEKVRADQSQALLNYGFGFFETHKLYGAGDLVAEPRLWHGADDKARLGLAHAAMVTIPRGSYDRLVASMNIPKPLSAPLAKGQEAGRLVVSLDGAELLNTPLVALADFPPGGVFSRMSDTVWLWFSDGE